MSRTRREAFVRIVNGDSGTAPVALSGVEAATLMQQRAGGG